METIVTQKLICLSSFPEVFKRKVHLKHGRLIVSAKTKLVLTALHLNEGKANYSHFLQIGSIRNYFEQKNETFTQSACSEWKSYKSNVISGTVFRKLKISERSEIRYEIGIRLTD